MAFGKWRTTVIPQISCHKFGILMKMSVIFLNRQIPVFALSSKFGEIEPLYVSVFRFFFSLAQRKKKSFQLQVFTKKPQNLTFHVDDGGRRHKNTIKKVGFISREEKTQRCIEINREHHRYLYYETDDQQLFCHIRHAI